jgi:hypothetical protein
MPLPEKTVDNPGSETMTPQPHADDDFLMTELARRGYTSKDVRDLADKIEAKVKSLKPCKSKIRFRGETLECMDYEGHKACHYHLNVAWPL